MVLYVHDWVCEFYSTSIFRNQFSRMYGGIWCCMFMIEYVNFILLLYYLKTFFFREISFHVCMEVYAVVSSWLSMWIFFLLLYYLKTFLWSSRVMISDLKRLYMMFCFAWCKSRKCQKVCHPCSDKITKKWPITRSPS